MSEHPDFTALQKQWQPPLIQLTNIGNGELDNKNLQPCYVDPTCIALIYRGMASWHNQSDGEKQPPQECTIVWLRGGGPSNVLVTESPEEVARQRDRAMELQTPSSATVRPIK